MHLESRRIVSSALKNFETFMNEALVKSLADFSLDRLTAPPQSAELLKTRLCFEGAGMKAQAFISCSRPFLQTTCPLPRGPVDHSQAVIKDWLGELGNLILGRLKNRLLAHDVTIKISAPSFDGDWQTAKTVQAPAVWLQGAGGFIGFDCSIEGTIPEIGEATKQSAEILPGDAIYRLNDPANSKATYDIIAKIRSGTDRDKDSEDESGEDNFGDAEGELESEHYSAIQQADPMQANCGNLIRTTEAEKEIQAKSSQRPIRILFHSQLHTPLLTSLSWTQIDKLILHFNTGLEYSICPRTLLEKGTATFEVEGVAMLFQRDGDWIRTSIPTYNMYMSKSSRVA